MFVANRVQTIREDSDPSQWQYVDTKSNLADHASRGLTASRIEDSNWFTDPEFLWKAEIKYSENHEELAPDDREVRTKVVLKKQTCPPSLLARFSKFLNWSSLVRTIARLLRRARGGKNTSLSTLQERQDAKLFILRLCQKGNIETKGIAEQPRSL